MGYWGYLLFNQGAELKKDLTEVNAEIQPLVEENRRLVDEIKYLKDPDNLEKELRSRLNYVRPGEQVIVITP